MKKIFTILLSAAMVLFAASCTQVEKTVVSTGESVAPVIVSGSTASGLSATYTPGQLVINGETVARKLMHHFFAAVKIDSADVSIAVASKDNPESNTVTATAATVNSLLVSRGFENGSQVHVVFVLRAGLSDVANTGFVDSEETLEMDVTVKAVVEELSYFADYSDYTEVSKWSVIGSIASTENGWNKDEAMKTNGIAHVCEGLALAADDEFKFRYEADWGTNIGLDAKDPTAVAIGNEYPGKGGGANIKVPEDGVYDLFVIRDSLKTEAEAKPEDYIFKVIKHYDNPYKDWTASDVWSVIGSIASTGNGWNQDEPMISNGTWWVCRNLKLTSEDEFKFRKDHDWGVNIGLDGDKAAAAPLGVLNTGKGGGPNIMVAEDGTYDLLVKPAAAEGEDDVFEICVAGTVPVFE